MLFRHTQVRLLCQINHRSAFWLPCERVQTTPPGDALTVTADCVGQVSEMGPAPNRLMYYGASHILRMDTGIVAKGVAIGVDAGVG